MSARGNVTKERLGNGYTTTRTYDPKTGRQTNMIATLGASIHTLVDVDSQWDQLGNLTGRSKKRYDDLNALTVDQSESFGYDHLNRLTSTSVVGGESTTISYDAYGNIKSKTGVGTYSYDGPDGGPHAVTGIDDGSSVAPYAYDANGNLTSNTMADGQSRTIEYTTFDKPNKIEKGNHRTEFQQKIGVRPQLFLTQDATNTP